MNLTQLKTQIYYRDAKLPELTSNEVFMSLVDRAIVNVRGGLKAFTPNVFEGWLNSQTSPVTIPDDCIHNETPLFYTTNNTQFPISDDNWYRKADKWYFSGTLDILYPKDIARFTLMSTELPFKNRKSEEMLISEVMALIYRWHEENEATPSVTEAITQSNSIQ